MRQTSHRRTCQAVEVLIGSCDWNMICSIVFGVLGKLDVSGRTNARPSSIFLLATASRYAP